MATPNDSAGQPSQPITFTSKSADRIASVVRKVEQGRRDQVPFLPNASSMLPQKVFRTCTFTSAWSKNTLQTVTFRNITSTPNTVSAINIFANIGGTGTRNCAIARDGTAWFLIAAEC
jgi:hypothetical protein